MNRPGLIGAILLAVAPAVASAAPPEASWYWYYATLDGQTDEPGHTTSVRSHHGVATVQISGSKIAIEFDDVTDPELHPKFTGRIAKNGAINGNLPNFYGGDAPGPGPVAGQYRKAPWPGCWLEDIHLQQTFPDLDAWVLFRQHGTCMPNDGVNNEPPLAR